MKKIILAALCLLSFAALNAQTYTSGHITATVLPNMIHDSTTCQSTCEVLYNITIDSSYIGDSIKIVDTITASLLYAGRDSVGTSPWIVTVVIPMFTPTLPDNFISGGIAFFTGPITKIICGLDTDAYILNNFGLTVTNPCLYNNVTGMVYVDNNSNCIFDAGDVALNGVTVNASENLSSSTGGMSYSTSTTAGPYTLQSIQQSWMVNYSVSLPPYYPFIFPYSPCFSGYSPFTTLPQSGVDFPLQCTSNVDVQCYALSPVSVRLHRPFYMQPYVSNTGCDSASGELTVVLDSRVIYDPTMSVYPADTVHGDTLIWNYNNLTNLTSGAYWNCFLSDIYLTPDSTVAVGDTLCFRVYTNIPPTDINPLNNDYSVCLPAVYSYDPNVKVVSPAGIGTQGYIPGGHDTLTYDLHFQNTGTDMAYNISIIDTLDSHINANSLKVLGASASMLPQWLAPGIVQFNFNNIDLPDSTSNEAASYGAVRFQVALNNSLAPGTQIKNTGYIYFDSNPAVVTNTTLNTIDTVVTTTTTKTGNITAGPGVRVYPNPATDNITVENLNGGEISILNINGVVVLSQYVTSNKTTIDVSGLANGVYILKTVNNANTTTTKFTKY